MMLMLAAALFWISWALMPGVGVTDAREIFALVASQRGMVAASVVAQLVSAALFAPALAGVLADPTLGRDRGVRGSATLLLVGAMGSAADAVLHLLAFAMTAPGIDRAPMVEVMTFMQGPGLALLAPMVLSFFAGGAWLSVALARLGVGSAWHARTHGLALGVAIVGGALASAGLAPARIVGLAALGLVSGAQAGAGLAFTRRRQSIR